jgi:hypothetical protein
MSVQLDLNGIDLESGLTISSFLNYDKNSKNYKNYGSRWRFPWERDSDSVGLPWISSAEGKLQAER